VLCQVRSGESGRKSLADGRRAASCEKPQVSGRGVESELIEAQKHLNKGGILFETPNGYIQQNPLLGIIRVQMSIVNGLVREFGLTPSSRTRIAVEEPDTSDADFWRRPLAATFATPTHPNKLKIEIGPIAKPIPFARNARKIPRTFDKTICRT
jgi:Phage terminase, small subunit